MSYCLVRIRSSSIYMHNQTFSQCTYCIKKYNYQKLEKKHDTIETTLVQRHCLCALLCLQSLAPGPILLLSGPLQESALCSRPLPVYPLLYPTTAGLHSGMTKSYYRSRTKVVLPMLGVLVNRSFSAKQATPQSHTNRSCEESPAVVSIGKHCCKRCYLKEVQCHVVLLSTGHLQICGRRQEFIVEYATL